MSLFTVKLCSGINMSLNFLVTADQHTQTSRATHWCPTAPNHLPSVIRNKITGFIWHIVMSKCVTFLKGGPEQRCRLAWKVENVQLMSNCGLQLTVLRTDQFIILSVFACKKYSFWLKFELLRVWLYWFAHCRWREVWLVTCLILSVSLHVLAVLMLPIQTAQHKNGSTHSHVFTTVKCWLLTKKTQNETKNCRFFSSFFFLAVVIDRALDTFFYFSSPLMLCSVILLSFFTPCSLILQVVVDCFGGDTFCVMTVWFYMWLLFQGQHILHATSLILQVVVDCFNGDTFCMKTVWFHMWLLTVSRATHSAWRQFDFTCGCWLFQGRHILRDDFTACPSCDFPAIFSEFIRFVLMSGASISCDLQVAHFSVLGL